MHSEKRFFQYCFLILFTVLTGYSFLVRASFYDEDGLPRVRKDVLTVIGENLASDYALFRLLERKTPPQEAYKPENISGFLRKTVHAEGAFHSFASPMKAFLSVPLLPQAYNNFCETWLFFGLFLFGAALYTLLPLKQVLLLIFALPAGFLSFGTGGWGVFAASAVILALTLTEDYPKAAAFFAGLCVIEPVVFVFLIAVFLLRRQRKAAFFGAVFGSALTAFAFVRYGEQAFETAFSSAWTVLTERSCLLTSLSSSLACNGMPLFFALMVHGAVVAWMVFYGFRLFRKVSCPQAVQDAYLCAMLCLISPFTVLGDYGMLYAGIAFLWRDSEARGFLKGDFYFLFFAFASIYLESFWMRLSGSSFQMMLAAILLLLSYRRSY